MRTRATILLAALLLACKREPPPPAPVIDARPAAPAAAPDLLPAHPELCEVEILGQVALPKGTKKGTQAAIIAALGDCLAEDAKVLGRARSGPDGSFFIEVFSPWGSDLSVCAALEPGEGKPATAYGKAEGTLHAEGLGEVVFKDQRIALKKGPPRAFPLYAPGKP